MTSGYTRYPKATGGGGVTSLNSLTGDLSLTSTDSSITITPSGSTIDLSSQKLTLTNLTDIGTDGLVITNGIGAVVGSSPVTIAQHIADTTHNGYLSSTDWNTFNGKQASGNYITALSGDVVATGPGSAAGTIQNNVVTNAKLAQMATLTIKGNITGGTANAVDLTVAQVNSVLPVFTSTLNGLVPLSGGGTTTFLRADGTFATPAGGGTVTAVSIATANGFSGTSSGGSTPALTLSIPASGIIKSNGTAVGAATAGTDYSAGTSGLTTGILKSTTSTGALTIAIAADFPTLNQNTSGNAATVTTNANLTGDVTSVGNATTLATVNSNVGAFTNANITVNAKGLITAAANGASSSPNIVTKTSAYSAVVNDYIFCSNSGASYAIQLPTAVGNSGKYIWIKRTDNALASPITITSTSGQALDIYASGVPTVVTQSEYYAWISDGTQWWIDEHSAGTPWSSSVPIAISATSAYIFTVTAANATVGAIYSNSGFLFTVSTTIAAGLTLTCSGTGTPATSGTLTKVSGTGDATITYASRTITGAPVFGVTSLNAAAWRRDGIFSYQRFNLTQTATTGSSPGVGDIILRFVDSGLLADTTIQPIINASATIGVGLSSNNLAQPSSLNATGFMCVGAANYLLPLNAYLYSPNSCRISGLQVVASNVNWSGANHAPNSATLSIGIEIRTTMAGWIA